VDGVDGADAVIAYGCTRQYSASGEGVPVAGDGLMSFGAFEGLLAGVCLSRDLVVEVFGEVVSGMAALGPVAVPVGSDSLLDRTAIRIAVRSRGTLPSLASRIAAALIFGRKARSGRPKWWRRSGRAPAAAARRGSR
jgi:hypothetical protein